MSGPSFRGWMKSCGAGSVDFGAGGGSNAYAEGFERYKDVADSDGSDMEVVTLDEAGGDQLRTHCEVDRSKGLTSGGL